MDIEKLFSVLTDLQNEEEEHNLQTLFDSFQSNFNNVEEADKNKKEILKICKISRFKDYSLSKLNILKKIGAYEFVGLGTIEFLNKTFRIDTYKAKGVLAKYIQKRQIFFNNLEKYITLLKELNFEPYYEDLKLAEIGLILPKQIRDIEQIEDYLNKLNFILRGVSEVATGSVAPSAITSLNRGTLEFFTQHHLETAICLTLLFNGVLRIYEKILKIKKLKEELKEFKIKKIEKEMEEKEKEFIEKGKEEIVKDIFLKFKNNKRVPGRDKELKSHLMKSIDYLIKMRDQGAVVETTPPTIKKPEITKEGGAKEEKKYQTKLEKIKTLYEISNSTKKLLQITKDILKIGHLIKDEEGEE